METAQSKREEQAFSQGAGGFPTSTATRFGPLLSAPDGVRHQGQVVGRPAEKEQPHQAQEEPEGSLILEVQAGSSPEPQKEAGAAEDQDGGGQEESYDEVEQARGQPPVDTGARSRQRVVVDTLYSAPRPDLRRGPQEDPVGDGEEQGEEPYGQAAGLHHPGLPAGEEVCGAEDGEVAVEAHADQQEDPTVEVDL